MDGVARDEPQRDRLAAPSVLFASPCLRKLGARRDDGVWEYTEPDWDELKHVVTGHGPRTEERLAFRRRFLEQEQWVRDAVLAA